MRKALALAVLVPVLAACTHSASPTTIGARRPTQSAIAAGTDPTAAARLVFWSALAKKYPCATIASSSDEALAVVPRWWEPDVFDFRCDVCYRPPRSLTKRYRYRLDGWVKMLSGDEGKVEFAKVTPVPVYGGEDPPPEPCRRR